MSIQDLLNVVGQFLADHLLMRRLFVATLELAVLAPVVYALIRVARIRSPRVVALLLLVVLIKPIVTLSVGSPLGIVLFEAPAPAVAIEADALPAAVSTPSLSPEPIPFAMPVELIPEALPAAPPVAMPDGALASATHSALLDVVTVSRALSAVWLIGVGFFVLRYVVSRITLHRLIRAAQPPEMDIAERYCAIAAHLGLKREPRLLITDALESPAIAGIVRSTILMPRYLAQDVPDDRFDWSVRHELTHYRWRDMAAIFVRDIAVTLFYFHPAVWWASRRLAESLELACDRAMIRDADEAPHYAEQLYQILQHMRLRRPRPAVATGLFATRTQVGQRIAALLDASFPTVPQLTIASVVGVALIAAAALTFGPEFTAAAVESESSGQAVTDASADDASAAAPGGRQRLAATLPSGVEVELLGVCEHPSTGKTWWRPDGSPLAEAPYEDVTGNVLPDPDERAREFAARVSGDPSTLGGIRWQILSTQGSGSMWSASVTVQEDGTRVGGAVFSMPREWRAVNVRVGIAATAWQTVAASPGGSLTQNDASAGIPGAGASVAFSPAIAAGDEIVLTVTDDVKGDFARRVVAVDHDGQVHTARRSRSSGGAKMYQTTKRFRDLEPDQIREFRFQIRPYEWVEFRDVSLDADRQTDVKVVVDPPEPPDNMIAMRRVSRSAMSSSTGAAPGKATEARTLGGHSGPLNPLPFDGPELSEAERRRMEELLERLIAGKLTDNAAAKLIEMGPGVAPHMLPLLDHGGTDDPAIEVLKGLALDPSVQRLMLAILDQPPYRVINRRYAALLVLGESGETRHVPRILEALTRAAALDPPIAGGEAGPIYALSEIGGDVGYEALVKSIDIVSSDFYWIALEELAQTGQPEAVPHLHKALQRIDWPHMSNTFQRVASAIRKLERNAGLPMTQKQDLYAIVRHSAHSRNATINNAATARFSRPFEQDLQDMGTSHTELYDLDTGQRLRLWEGSLKSWARASGADLQVHMKEDGLILAAMDMNLEELQPDAWDTFTPENVAGRLVGPLPDGRMAYRFEQRPAINTTFAYRTREGGIGIFRIIKWIEDAPCMRVELRILRRAQRAASDDRSDAASQPDQSELLEYHRKAQESMLFLALKEHPKIQLGGHSVSFEHDTMFANVPGSWRSHSDASGNGKAGRDEFERLLGKVTDTRWSWQLVAFNPHTASEQDGEPPIYDFYLKGAMN